MSPALLKTEGPIKTIVVVNQ